MSPDHVRRRVRRRHVPGPRPETCPPPTCPGTTSRDVSAPAGPTRREPSGYVIAYSGPDPPSGGVSLPPFAVIAPHWTQFDAVTSTATLPPPSSSPPSPPSPPPLR